MITGPSTREPGVSEIETSAVDAQDGRDAVLSVSAAEKHYLGTTALDRVDLEFQQGEIHALLGGNGSGKSTLIKLLAGVERADGGSLETSGASHCLADWTPQDAWSHGLRFVHQQSSVFLDLTVAENLAIGHGFERGRLGKIDWRRQNLRAREVLGRFHIDVSPEALLGEIGPAQRSMIAIARGLQDQDEERRGVLFLDEITAALPDRESELLLAALRRYADLGQTIVFISHRLGEVEELADRATVLTDGRVAGQLAGNEITHESLVDLIVGESDSVSASPPTLAGEANRRAEVLRLEGVSSHGVSDIDLTVRAGEVVGVAGLLGSGRTALLRSIFGADDRHGRILIDGKEVAGGDVRLAMQMGLALVPENRALEAAFSDLTVAQNLSATSPATSWKGMRLDRRKESAEAAGLIEAFAIKTPSPSAPLGTLSGGNQQKVITARWLRRKPRVLLLDEPTQGVDVGARAEIHALIRSAAQDGTAVIVASSDAEELVQLSDRVIVLIEGRVAWEVDGEDLNDEQISRLIHAEKEAA